MNKYHSIPLFPDSINEYEIALRADKLNIDLWNALWIFYKKFSIEFWRDFESEIDWYYCAINTIDTDNLDLFKKIIDNNFISILALGSEGSFLMYSSHLGKLDFCTYIIEVDKDTVKQKHNNMTAKSLALTLECRKLLEKYE